MVCVSLLTPFVGYIYICWDTHTIDGVNLSIFRMHLSTECLCVCVCVRVWVWVWVYVFVCAWVYRVAKTHRMP